MKKATTARRPSFYVVTAAVAVLAVTAVFFVRAAFIDVYEEAALFIDPSASRAFNYGERHFDARDPALYDIARAQRLFTDAASRDPRYPYVFHELARISFLRGNLAQAMSQIDLQIQMHGATAANSYYVRGLIEGYMGHYDAAISDYATYLKADPRNWAALNDYAWVLLKAERFDEAAGVAAHGISLMPQNPWLLNSYAIATYELGHYPQALDAATEAHRAATSVTTADWLTAYPGNDPKVAGEGIDTLKRSIDENMHMIRLAIASSTVQYR